MPNPTINWMPTSTSHPNDGDPHLILTADGKVGTARYCDNYHSKDEWNHIENAVPGEPCWYQHWRDEGGDFTWKVDPEYWSDAPLMDGWYPFTM